MYVKNMLIRKAINEIHDMLPGTSAEILYKAQEKINLMYYLEIITFSQFQFETDRITHLLKTVGVDRDDI